MLTAEVGASVEIERGGDIDVFEKLEIDVEGNAMLHTVFPLEKVGFQKLTFGSGKRIGEAAGIGETDFFVPSFGTDLLFTAKRIET